MKVCIVGAGAIGGFLGTRLAAAAGAELSAVARGATLEALREHGWRLQDASGLVQAPARVSEAPAELGEQDLVIIAVKGPSLAAIASEISPLLGPQTLVLPAMNGVPWWFCQDVPEFGDGPLCSVDPDGTIASAISRSRVIGCVVHASTSTIAPGLVLHKMGSGLMIGEPSGGRSERVERIAQLLKHAGFEVTQSTDVRYEIWYKLWGNLTMNPVSALTGATTDRILADPLLRKFCSAVMVEANVLGGRLGVPIAQTPDHRHAITARLGAFKTSMLQDVQAGRAIELDAIVGAVHEIGQRLGVAMPATDALFGLARVFGRTHGIYDIG